LPFIISTDLAYKILQLHIIYQHHFSWATTLKTRETNAQTEVSDKD